MKKLSLRGICHLGILVALEVVLNRFCSIQTPFLKIGFSFVPVMLGGMLYGPVGGAVVGGLGDMAGALLFPFGPYHPGFSICAAAMGWLYGRFLYLQAPANRDRVRLWPNIIVPVAVNCAVLGLLVNTVWISQLYGSKTYWGWLVSRIPQEVGLAVVKAALAPVLVQAARQLYKLGVVAPDA